MRANDFLDTVNEDGDVHSNVITALSLIKSKIDQGELKSKLPVQFVVRLIQNTGASSFSLEDLMAANDEIPAMKNIIKQITPNEIVFVTHSYSNVSNTQDSESSGTSVDNPAQTVSNMAKSALKRRQS
jgi:cystathionine beta-lyase family protein involved in aluminum resistance